MRASLDQAQNKPLELQKLLSFNPQQKDYNCQEFHRYLDKFINFMVDTGYQISQEDLYKVEDLFYLTNDLYFKSALENDTLLTIFWNACDLYDLMLTNPDKGKVDGEFFLDCLLSKQVVVFNPFNSSHQKEDDLAVSINLAQFLFMQPTIIETSLFSEQNNDSHDIFKFALLNRDRLLEPVEVWRGGVCKKMQVDDFVFTYSSGVSAFLFPLFSKNKTDAMTYLLNTVMNRDSEWVLEFIKSTELTTCECAQVAVEFFNNKELVKTWSEGAVREVSEYVFLLKEKYDLLDCISVKSEEKKPVIKL